MNLRLGTHDFDDNALLVMAIINRTPDSFFDKGATYADDAALDAVDRAVAEGADILDVGGVKAGPGTEVDEAEELRRTASFVTTIRSRYPAAVISVDTWRSGVARVLAAEGADLINDSWGGYDPDVAIAAADAGIGLVCMHTGGAKPRSRPHRVAYGTTPYDVVTDVLATCERLVKAALEIGVRPDGILVDPGHDFGKSSRQSLLVTRELPVLVDTGWPVLVALSNKDFIGETLDVAVEERLEGTLAATAVSAWLGARVFRAHQVRETRRVLDTVASIRGTRDVAVARRGLA